MTPDETVALWQKCEEARIVALSEGKSDIEAHDVAKDIWNNWAKSILEEKERLVAENNFITGPAAHRLEEWVAPETIGLNKETIEWLDRSRVDFNGFNFEERAYFADFIFPGQAIFGGSKTYTRSRAKRPAVEFLKDDIILDVPG